MPTNRVIQGLSFASSIFLVEVLDDPPSYECRKCLVLDVRGTKTAALSNLRAALDHLDLHVRCGEHSAGGNGAKDAITKLEQCEACRGAGRVREGLNWKPCEPCGQTGKNEAGRDRGVRRGVVV